MIRPQPLPVANTVFASHTLCTAPMMDWSDRHCRYFFRQLSPRARVYTEMVTTGALLHGNVPSHLDFDAAEHPVALQLGGSEPVELALCAKLGADYGYDEVNLNCGCPSERVQHGAFGACLMAEPELVADCVRAMREAVSIPVTVKHRLGIDSIEEFEFVYRFVATVSQAGCHHFLVHARNAILKGLSPKDNRSVPPLKYDFVRRLRREFPDLIFVVNGGISDVDSIDEHLEYCDGVMLGRAAYQNPWLLAKIESHLFGTAALNRLQVVNAMCDYARRQCAQGVALRSIVRHMLGLYRGQPNASHFRRMLSNANLLASNLPELLLEAAQIAEDALPIRAVA
ncbi:MAG: tRNA dihydrouridine(20/20a) synthase DusA [Burkholderiales bacterium]